MADLLARHNRHLFLEKQKNAANSFIANVNLLASKYPKLEEFNEKFDAADLELLYKLGTGDLDLNLDYIADDLAKGTHYGSRKIDIDLLTNFQDYDPLMTTAEKRALWSDPLKQVYYDAIRVYFTDSSYVDKALDTPINNHHQLRDAFQNWPALEAKMGDTAFEIFPTEELEEHELFRIYDSKVDNTTQGSKIYRVVLYTSASAYGTNLPTLDSVCKALEPSFSWDATTSALLTMATRLQNLIYTAQFIEAVGSDYVEQLQNVIDSIAAMRDRAEAAAREAEDVQRKYQRLQVRANPIEPMMDPDVTYDPFNNRFTFDLPRSTTSLIDLTHFLVDPSTGHLIFETVNAADATSIRIDDNTGDIIISFGTPGTDESESGDGSESGSTTPTSEESGNEPESQGSSTTPTEESESESEGAGTTPSETEESESESESNTVGG